MIRLIGGLLAISIGTACATSSAFLAENERGPIKREAAIRDRDAAWVAALDGLASRGYTVQALEKESGLISSGWSHWDCLTDAQKTWGSFLVGRTASCRKQVSVTFRDNRVIVRSSAQICRAHSNGHLVGTPLAVTPETCSDNDVRELADRMSTETDALVTAIVSAGATERGPYEQASLPAW